MQGLGFMYQQHKIVAEVGADDNLTGEPTSILIMNGRIASGALRHSVFLCQPTHRDPNV